jgi:hypothetical protein
MPDDDLSGFLVACFASELLFDGKILILTRPPAAYLAQISSRIYAYFAV